jgi:hypothetical protein
MTSNGESTLRKRTPLEQDMPEDVRATKEKLEKTTGKKYVYRPPKNDLPNIGDMLKYGSPESQGRQRTWLETIGYPLGLAVLFFLSFIIFLNAPHHKSRRQPKMKLPDYIPKLQRTQKQPLHMDSLKDVETDATRP